MNLTEMKDAIRTELKDPATLWSDSELDRAITEAVADVSRFFPLEKIYEETIEIEVKDESWTSGASPGDWVQLANEPIEYNSETVKNSAGKEATRDTDYKMDYSNGKITHISGGVIGNNETCTISYSKSKIAIDISALNIVRVFRVEYPYGKVPQSFCSFNIYEDKLWLTGKEAEGQSKMNEKAHLVLYYSTVHSTPTATASGSYPRHLDEIVVKGASAYACLIKGAEFEHNAATALNKISHAKIGTALDAVATKLGLVNTYLTGAADPSAKKYLTDGDDYIPTRNIADRVAENYSDYAQRSINIATALVTEAAQYNAEASGRLGEIDRYLAEASQSITLADRWKAEGMQRLTEFHNILRDRAELRGRSIATTTARQLK